MTELSNFLENKILDHTLGGGDYAPAALFAELSTTTISDASAPTPPAGGGYARANAGSAFGTAAASSSITNNAAISYGTSAGSWGTVTDMALYDASTAGNMLMYTALNTSKTIPTGKPVSIPTGVLTATLGAGMSNDLANKMLNHLLRAVTYTRLATVHFALCTAAPTQASTGSSLSEVSGGSYARVAIANNATNFPAAASGSKSNGTSITFPNPTAAWGTITHWAIVSAASAGDLLYYGAWASSFAPASGDVVSILASTLTISMD